MATKASIYERRLVHEIKNTPEEYLPNLLQIVRLFRESVALNPAEASFRQGWEEAQEGKTLPVSRLWEGMGFVWGKGTEKCGGPRGPTFPCQGDGTVTDSTRQ